MYTAHLSKHGAVYLKDGKPITYEEFQAALTEMANHIGDANKMVQPKSPPPPQGSE